MPPPHTRIMFILANTEGTIPNFKLTLLRSSSKKLWLSASEIIASNLRLDLIIDRKIIIEIKSVIEYKKVFEKQLYTYLRLMNCEMGYVVNFNTSYLRGSIRPVRNHLYKSEGLDEGEKQ